MLGTIAIEILSTKLIKLVAAAVNKYLAYRYGRKTQEGIYKDDALKKQKKADEIAARPAGSIDDIINRL